MKNVVQLINMGKQFTTHNAPAILTAVGIVGTVGTAYLTGKASFKAADKIRDAKIEQFTTHEGPITDKLQLDLSAKEKVKLTWLMYLPAAGAGIGTITAIFMAQKINASRLAAMAGAYAISERAYNEYKEKVQEKFGIAKEANVRDEIAQDRVSSVFETGSFDFFNPMSGKVWVMEAYTGRPFPSTVEHVNQAVNTINHYIQREGSARMSDFYDEINRIEKAPKDRPVLDHVSTSDHFGWTRDDLLDIDWSTTTSPDGSIAVHVFEYVGGPVLNPEREANTFP